MPPKCHRRKLSERSQRQNRGVLNSFKQNIRRKLWHSSNSQDADKVKMPPPLLPPPKEPQPGTSTRTTPPTNPSTGIQGKADPPTTLGSTQGRSAPPNSSTSTQGRANPPTTTPGSTQGRANPPTSTGTPGRAYPTSTSTQGRAPPTNSSTSTQGRANPPTPSTSTQGRAAPPTSSTGTQGRAASNGSTKRKSREEETERTFSKKHKSDPRTLDQVQVQSIPLVRRIFKSSLKIDSNAKTPRTSSSEKEETAEETLPKRKTGSDPGPIRKEKYGSRKVSSPYQKQRSKPFSEPGPIRKELSNSDSESGQKERYRAPSEPGPSQKEGNWFNCISGVSQEKLYWVDCNSNPNQAKAESKLQEQGSESTAHEWKIEVIPTDFTVFSEKYHIEDLLCYGGYATVFRGNRKSDNMPVAIKRIPYSSITWVTVDDRPIPKEVQMLCRVGAEVPNSVTPVLLDWYHLGSEVVLVLERPEPCQDLVDYVNGLNRYITEEEGKTIFSQLVDAALTMDSQGVVHMDIKPDNVLVTRGTHGLQVKFIDFGCATEFVPGQVFTDCQGTDIYTSPEFYRTGRYEAGSMTAWQLGLTLYAMTNTKRPFGSARTIANARQPPIRTGLSDDCRDLLKKLMDKDPETRLRLQEIKSHPWMI